MTELPPEEAETEQNEAAKETAAEKKASKKTVKKETEGTPSGAPPANNNEEREDENLGISQPELGFWERCFFRKTAVNDMFAAVFSYKTSRFLHESYSKRYFPLEKSGKEAYFCCM